LINTSTQKYAGSQGNGVSWNMAVLWDGGRRLTPPAVFLAKTAHGDEL
jgi:hypothetical protein